ncbi:hypothetical protein D3C81_914740 [compost metagenome]
MVLIAMGCDYDMYFVNASLLKQRYKAFSANFIRRFSIAPFISLFTECYSTSTINQYIFPGRRRNKSTVSLTHINELYMAKTSFISRSITRQHQTY